MSETLVEITLPLTEQGLWGVLFLLILFGVIWLALAGDDIKPADEPALRALTAFACVYGVIWLVILLSTLQALWFVFTGAGSALLSDEFRSLGVGALVFYA